METKFWVVLFASVAAVSAVVAGSLFMFGSPSGYGRLAVEVHDAPCQNCTHVWVTFQSVSVHASNTSGSGWTTLNVSGGTVDLMALNGTALAKQIGVTSLKVGHYEQVRLAVTNVTVMLSNGTTLVASVPSASSADVNGEFNITSGATTTLSIDIDLASSLHIVGGGPGLRAIFTPNIGSVVVV
ncbi:MAG TPA: DUF4382 domain-containing protein [Thermoplasmata archaeon]|nr:DUF4382 domain-containing protein [Thermoplasmata archaeon]